MFDDLPTPKKDKDFPRNLENMSVEELELYIQDLHNEIIRVQADMEKKKASRAAADSVFG